MYIIQYYRAEGVTNVCDHLKPIRDVITKIENAITERNNNNCFVFVKGEQILRDPPIVQR